MSGPATAPAAEGAKSWSPPSPTAGAGNPEATAPPPDTSNSQMLIGMAPPPASGSESPPPASSPPPAQSPPPPQASPPPQGSPPPKSPPISPPPPNSSPPPPSKTPSPPPLPQSIPSPPPPSPPPNVVPSITPNPPPPASTPSTGGESPPPPLQPPPPPQPLSPIAVSPPIDPSLITPPPPTPTAPTTPSNIPPAPPFTAPPNPETPADPNNSMKPTPSTPSTGNRNEGLSQAHVGAFSPPPSSTTVSPGTKNAVIVGLSILVLALLASAVMFCLVSKKKKRTKGLGSQYRPAPSNFPMVPGRFANGTTANSTVSSKTPSSPSAIAYSGGSFRAAQAGFTYEELIDITNNFSPDNVIGEGGFGSVYKGYLPDGRPVAVKQLKVGSGQGEREFRAEVDIISRVHHRHLVSLVGYCIEDSQRLLVYEFVPNKTLQYHLHAKELPALDWAKRMRIAIGSARGLSYLHDDCHPRIIHRDIKSANILLENSFEAQVADFGLAKLTNDSHTHVSTRVMGTFGYMAPEYASSGKLTDRSDVFSFGVVLLELITGHKPVDPSRPLGDESLVEWARPLLVQALEVGEYDKIVDPRLENNYVRTEMHRMVEVATACVRHSAPKRPRMVQVLRALDSEGDMSDLSNGVKFGQSVIYDSSQYSMDIETFRKMAFGSDQSSPDNYSHSGIIYSGEAPYAQLETIGSRDTSEYESSFSSDSRTVSARASPRFAGNHNHVYNDKGCP